MKYKIDETDAFIIVDVQRDFCPGGALPVPGSNQIIPVLNDYIKIFKQARAHIYATRDWHPPNHVSFESYGGVWPPHCIQETDGAKFHPKLRLPEDVIIISKATTPSKESYSGFGGTKLNVELKMKAIKRIFVGGLATDYCVKHTVIDALRLGFDTILLVDAIRGVNIQPNDSKKAIEETTKYGAKKATISDIFIEASTKGSNTLEQIEDDALRRAEDKKKARLRTRGPYRKTWNIRQSEGK